MRLPTILLAVALPLLACGHTPPPCPAQAIASPASAPSARVSQAAPEVTVGAILGPLRFLSDDRLEGRGPGTRGSELAMRYIAAEYEAMGLEPGGEGGTFFQKVPLVGVTPHLPAEATFGAQRSALKLKVGEDVVIVPGLPRTDNAIDAPDVVFAGYGITAPEYHWDDYKGADVRGKVVLLMNNDPSSAPDLFAGETRLWYGRWDYKYLEAAKRGAVGAIIIHTTPSAGYPWQVVATSNTGEKFQLKGDADPELVLRMWATEEASRKLAALGGKDLDLLRKSAESRDFHPTPLGVHVALHVTSDVREIDSANVIGRLTGSDGAMSREAVVVSAHHDHLGIGPAKNGDAIYNGAVDNASGVASMLAIARAAALGPRPKRSLLFMAVTAEEQGLLGSKWYADHPTVPAGLLAADLNVDMANVLGKTRDVSQIGRGKSDLDDVVDAIAKAQGRTVHADPMPDRGMFYRSDQFSFARIGVPGIFLRGSLDYVGRPEGWGKAQIEDFERNRYHQPSDQLDAAWDLRGAKDDCDLLLRAAIVIANAPAPPAWKSRDEFEAARKEAIQRGR